MPDSSAVTDVRHAPAEGHLKVHLENRPVETLFLFERPEKRLGGALGLSALTHASLFVLAFLAARYMPAPDPGRFFPQQLNKDIVWLSAPGPGGGGGGGGNQSPEPPRKAELPGKDKIAVPVAKPPKLKNPETKDEPKPEQLLNIPAKTISAGQETLPGALEATIARESQGSGSGGGAGTGTGTGIGPGQGSGLGPGWGGGTGGGAYRPGNGVELPRVIREVKPQYTADAMRAKVQGTVWLECIVLPDGSVGSVEVSKSLDPTFGLDQEAVKAAKQWRFVPGTRFGQPVPVIVTIELTFTLR